VAFASNARLYKLHLYSQQEETVYDPVQVRTVSDLTADPIANRSNSTGATIETIAIAVTICCSITEPDALAGRVADASRSDVHADV
jgi:hypothetical protein